MKIQHKSIEALSDAIDNLLDTLINEDMIEGTYAILAIGARKWKTSFLYP